MKSSSNPVFAAKVSVCCIWHKTSSDEEGHCRLVPAVIVGWRHCSRAVLGICQGSGIGQDHKELTVGVRHTQKSTGIKDTMQMTSRSVEKVPPFTLFFPLLFFIYGWISLNGFPLSPFYSSKCIIADSRPKLHFFPTDLLSIFICDKQTCCGCLYLS